MGLAGSTIFLFFIWLTEAGIKIASENVVFSLTIALKRFL